MLFLVDLSIHPPDSSEYTYVEVVLREPPEGVREGEGDFLEDSNAPHENRMRDISKLG